MTRRNLEPVSAPPPGLGRALSRCGAVALTLASALGSGCGEAGDREVRVSLLPQLATVEVAPAVRGDMDAFLRTAGMWAPLVPRGVPRGVSRGSESEDSVELPTTQVAFAEFWLPDRGQVELEFAAQLPGTLRAALQPVDETIGGVPQVAEIPAGAATHTLGGASVGAGRHLLELEASAAGTELARLEVRTPQELVSVVLIVVDTLRADHVFGPEGVHEGLEGFGRLERDGVGFPLAFSHTTTTLPAHTSILSSQMPHVTGVLVNGQSVPAGIPLLPVHLSGFGYATSGVVSLPVLAQRAREESLARAFTVYRHGEGHMLSAEDVFPVVLREVSAMSLRQPSMLLLHWMDPHDPYRAHGFQERLVEVRHNGELVGTLPSTDSMNWTCALTVTPGENVLELDSEDVFRTRRALVTVGGESLTPDFEVSRKERVTGLEHLRATWTHSGEGPVEAELELVVLDAPSHEEIRERYAREVRHVDTYLAQTLEYLERVGLYDDALIVLTSDHGELLGEYGLKGHGQTVSDPVIHVPLFIKPPVGHPGLEALRANRRGLVRHIDLTPTILHLLGLPALEGQTGTSLLEEESRVLISETHWRGGEGTLFGLRDEQFKLVYDVDAKTFALYDLTIDAGETVNVFEERGPERSGWPAVLEALSEREPNSASGEFSEALLEELASMGYGGDED